MNCTLSLLFPSTTKYYRRLRGAPLAIHRRELKFKGTWTTCFATRYSPPAGHPVTRSVFKKNKRGVCAKLYVRTPTFSRVEFVQALLGVIKAPRMRSGVHCRRHAILLFAFVVTLVVTRLSAHLTTLVFQKPAISGGIWLLWQIPRLRYYPKQCLRKFRRAIVKEVSLLIVDAAGVVLEDFVHQSSGVDSGSVLGN
jgi:hypothetical protein